MISMKRLLSRSGFPGVTDSRAQRLESVRTGIQEKPLDPGSPETLRQLCCQLFRKIREARPLTAVWLAAFSVFVSCSMHEEYTPPSPIELKPRQTKPLVYDQEAFSDKFGDEGLEPVDIEEEKSEDFDPRAEREKRIQDDIATAQRKQRAGKSTETAKKNIKIERKTADQLPTKIASPKKETEPVKNVESPKPESKMASDNFGSDDFGDLED